MSAELRKNRPPAHKEILQKKIKICTLLQERIKGAELHKDVIGFKIVKACKYAMSNFCR